MWTAWYPFEISLGTLAMAPFLPITRVPSLADKVVSLMLETITSSRLSPGDLLPSERELCEQFRVSRTVIREAVRSLVAKGLVEVHSGSGVRVAHMDGATLRESLCAFLRAGEGLDYAKVHEVRSVLEVQMVGAAASRATAAELVAMAEACESGAQAGNDIEIAVKAELLFHRTVAVASHNLLYIVLFDAIGDALVEVRQQTPLRSSLTQAVRSHREILAAVEHGNADVARAAMASHLVSVQRFWTLSQRTFVD